MDHLIDWGAEGGGQITIDINFKAEFPFEPAVGRAVLRRQAQTRFVSAATAYHKNAAQLHRLTIRTPANAEMSVVPASQEWVPIIDDLRTAMRTAPLDQLNIAMIHHRTWSAFTLTKRSDYDSSVYASHPELWDEYTPEPCGIQILTGKHLAKAHNLDDWNTTRLTDQPYLFQAKELGPGYGRPLGYSDQPDPELTAKARADFGDMVFTHDTATRLGISRAGS